MGPCLDPRRPAGTRSQAGPRVLTGVIGVAAGPVHGLAVGSSILLGAARRCGHLLVHLDRNAAGLARVEVADLEADPEVSPRIGAGILAVADAADHVAAAVVLVAPLRGFDAVILLARVAGGARAAALHDEGGIGPIGNCNARARARGVGLDDVAALDDGRVLAIEGAGDEKQGNETDHGELLWVSVRMDAARTLLDYSPGRKAQATPHQHGSPIPSMAPLVPV